jgi:hypothetical protein
MPHTFCLSFSHVFDWEKVSNIYQLWEGMGPHLAATFLLCKWSIHNSLFPQEIIYVKAVFEKWHKNKEVLTIYGKCWLISLAITNPHVFKLDKFEFKIEICYSISLALSKFHNLPNLQLCYLYMHWQYEVLYFGGKWNEIMFVTLTHRKQLLKSIYNFYSSEGPNWK